MCSFDPKAVASYLRSKGSGIPYKPQKVLDLCRKHNLTDAEAYVLEQDGKLVEAFNVIQRNLDKKMEEIITILSDDHADDTNDVSLAWSYVNTMIILLIQLCQKHHSKDMDIPASEKDKIWFELLESIIKPQRILYTKRSVISKRQLQPFKDAVKHVVNSALGYVSLRTLIETIVTDQVYQDDSFGDVREFFVGMLEMYHYEETLMKASCLAFRSDVHNRLSNLQKVSKKGVSSRKNDVRCDLCRKHLALQGGHCI